MTYRHSLLDMIEVESYDEVRIEQIKRLLSKKPEMVLIHVTDTYFVEESRVNGKIDLPGFSRFYSLVDSIRSNPIIQQNKIPILVVHGGDFLYPSLMSLFFHGRQMVDVLNLCKFNYCTLGNHDFDGGSESLKARMSEATFEIICANIKPSEVGDSPKILDYVICNDQLDEPCVAITGIAGKATLRKARQSGFTTILAESSLKQTIAKISKNHPKINNLIILSHMSNDEDTDLTKWLNKNWGGHVYLLGGHDHNKVLQYDDKNPNSILLKGQSNCRTVQIIGIPNKCNSKKIALLPEHVVVVNSAELSKFHQSKSIEKKVRYWTSRVEKHLEELKSDRIIKQFDKGTVLDATELQLRKGSTSFGNFIADCVLDFTDSDIVFVNSGHFRGDRKVGNILRMSDLRRIFVLDKKDTLVKITMTCKECKEFLQHAYSEEGRGKILQISKNTIKVLQESKLDEEFSVTMLWDMLKTNDDGFTTILAESRKKTENQLLSQLEKYVIPDSSLFRVVEKSSRHVKYDFHTRISVQKFADLFYM